MYGIPFCALSKDLADFYLSELKYRDVVNKWGGVKLVPERYHDFWLHEFLEKAEVILKFGISASLGEARHFGSEEKCFGDEDKVEGRTWDDFDRLQRMRDDLYSKLKLGFEYYGSRSGIYGLSLPSHSYEAFVLNVTDEVFASPWWDSGYGGMAWCNGVRLLKKVKYYMEKRELSNLIMWTDTFINHCHNGGKFLDKFSCGASFNICGVLDAKHKGELTFLRFVSEASTCGNGACSHRIWRNNHEQKEEEEEREEEGL